MPPCTDSSFARKMREQTRKFLEDCWYGGSSWYYLLLPLTWVFGFVSRFRRALYLLRILPRPKLAVSVIVVGNVSIGGTGKSPVTAWLINQLLEQGLHPGVVSRGYGGTEQREPLLVTAESDPAICGDEPVMLARATGVPVCVCIDRVAAVRWLAEHGVDVVISDDGLQHYRMRRTAEFIVVDGERGFGNGRLLPAGPLRESARRARKAAALLVNGGDGHIDGKRFELIPGRLTSLDGAEEKELESLVGKRVWAVAGIGNPERFFAQLERSGLEVDRVAIPDHGSCDLQALVSEKAQPILMTEKDAVKYRSGEVADVWYLPVTVQFEPADAVTLVDLVRRTVYIT